MSEFQSSNDRIASVAKFVLISAIVVVSALLVTAPKGEVYPGGPFMMRPAWAAAGGSAGGGVCSSPGYLLLTMGSTVDDKLFLVDTNKQVICVYSIVNDQFNLISARKFDYDSDIPEGSIDLPVGGKQLKVNSPNGINRDQAKSYGEEIKKKIDEGKTPKKVR